MSAPFRPLAEQITATAISGIKRTILPVGTSCRIAEEAVHNGLVKIELEHPIAGESPRWFVEAADLKFAVGKPVPAPLGERLTPEQHFEGWWAAHKGGLSVSHGLAPYPTARDAFLAGYGTGRADAIASAEGK